MKSIKIIITLLAILLLVGCGQQVNDTSSKGLDNDEDLVVPNNEVISDSASSDKTDLNGEVPGEDNIEKLQDLMKISEKLRVYPTSKKINSDESYAFALGIANSINNPVNVFGEVVFKKATDNYGNTIFVDETEINNWIKTNTFDLDILESDFVFEKVIVDVPSNAKNGNYRFGINSYEGESKDWDKPKDFYRTEFTIIVS